jgi:hypothetical protein
MTKQGMRIDLWYVEAFAPVQLRMLTIVQWYRNVWDPNVKSDGFKGQTIPPCVPSLYITVVFHQALHKNDTPMEHSTSRTPLTVRLWILAHATAPFNRTTSTASMNPHPGSIAGMLPTILLIL